MQRTRGIATMFRSVVGALGVVMLLGLTVGSALALPVPTPTPNSSIGLVTVISGAEIETINIAGSSGTVYKETVYMGPYNVPNPTFVDFMMCFNAGATASATASAWATDTAGAAVLFGADKVNMIAWLASQWSVSEPAASGKNADINKAMWEIMADYGGPLTVDGELKDARGNFYLNAGDGDINAVNALIAQALGYEHTYTEANFLIPLVPNLDGSWSYEISKQPFVQPVPEPGTLLLLGSGLTGLGLFGWRRRTKAAR